MAEGVGLDVRNRGLVDEVPLDLHRPTEAIQRVDEGEVSYEMTDRPLTPPTEDGTETTEPAGPEGDTPSADDEAKGENDTWTH